MTYHYNKKIAIYCLIMALSASMLGCTVESQSEQESVEVVEIVKEETSEEKTSKTIEISTEEYKETKDAYIVEIEIPVLKGFEDVTFMQEENKQLSEGVMAYAESIKQMALDIEEEGYLYSPYYVGVNYTVLLKNDAYMSIEVNYNEFTGGAHGNYFSEYLIYDLESERRLNLRDIVNQELDYMKVINEAVTQAIVDKRAHSEYGDALHSWYEGVEEETLSFSLQEEGVGIHFQPYEIGPYAEGAPSFLIPYERLSEILVINDF